MSLEQRIRDKLSGGLSPLRLDVINESHLHAGHAGDDGTGQTHFALRIVSDMFAGQSRVGRHRMINDVLAAEFRDGVHALSIKALTPDEAVE
jgi:BolA family transcriptional regulator, general stress-responsive regulator